MIGEIKAFLDKSVDIDGPVLTRAFARVQQHILDDRIRTLAVLHDLVEIALQRIRNLADLCSQLAVEVRSGKRLPQFVNEFDRDRRKIVDEIERVLDLVCDAGGELTERGELLGSARGGLGSCADPPETSLVHGCAPRRFSNNRTFSIAIAAWSANVVRISICLSVNDLAQYGSVTIRL